MTTHTTTEHPAICSMTHTQPKTLSGSPLFQRAIVEYDYKHLDNDLQLKAWSNTPWMIDVNVGCDEDSRHIGRSKLEQKMQSWCLEQFGDEAWPIHDRPGNWNRGGATIHGWVWYGFHTEAMMQQFMAEFPDYVDKAA